jgi:hypothetical protein
LRGFFCEYFSQGVVKICIFFLRGKYYRKKRLHKEEKVDRVHYRRVTPSKLRNEKTEPADPSRVETIILQSITSGILLIFILIISVLNIAPTENLRYGLREILSGATTPQELFLEVKNFGEEILERDFLERSLPEQSLPERDLPIQSTEPPTANHESSNPQIPGPLVTPELWD